MNLLGLTFRIIYGMLVRWWVRAMMRSLGMH